jgi:hypothetical protein
LTPTTPAPAAWPAAASGPWRCRSTGTPRLPARASPPARCGAADQALRVQARAQASPRLPPHRRTCVPASKPPHPPSVAAGAAAAEHPPRGRLRDPADPGDGLLSDRPPPCCRPRRAACAQRALRGEPAECGASACAGVGQRAPAAPRDGTGRLRALTGAPPPAPTSQAPAPERAVVLVATQAIRAVFSPAQWAEVRRGARSITYESAPNPSSEVCDLAASGPPPPPLRPLTTRHAPRTTAQRTRLALRRPSLLGRRRRRARRRAPASRRAALNGALSPRRWRRSARPCKPHSSANPATPLGSSPPSPITQSAAAAAAAGRRSRPRARGASRTPRAAQTRFAGHVLAHGSGALLARQAACAPEALPARCHGLPIPVGSPPTARARRPAALPSRCPAKAAPCIAPARDHYDPRRPVVDPPPPMSLSAALTPFPQPLPCSIFLFRRRGRARAGPPLGSPSPPASQGPLPRRAPRRAARPSCPNNASS